MKKINSELENILRQRAKDITYYEYLTVHLPMFLKSLPGGLTFDKEDIPILFKIKVFSNNVANLIVRSNYLKTDLSGMPIEYSRLADCTSEDYSNLLLKLSTPKGVRAIREEWAAICKALELPSDASVWRSSKPEGTDMKSIWNEFHIGMKSMLQL